MLGTSTLASSELSGTTNGLNKLNLSSRDRASTLIKGGKSGTTFPLATDPFQLGKLSQIAQSIGLSQGS